jgi:hypothetical protein
VPRVWVSEDLTGGIERCFDGVAMENILLFGLFGKLGMGFGRESKGEVATHPHVTICLLSLGFKA